MMRKKVSGEDISDIDMTGSIWPEFVKLADTYNQPGVFTAMTGFEWTSQPKQIPSCAR